MALYVDLHVLRIFKETKWTTQLVGQTFLKVGGWGGGGGWAETDHFVLVYFLNFEYLEKESKAM